MFAYCANDPVNNEDPDGDIAWWVGAAVGGAGKLVSKGARALSSARTARKVSKASKLRTASKVRKVSIKKTINANPLSNIKFTNKVKGQMKQGDYHSFLKSVEAFGSHGKVTKITGGDGVVRTRVHIDGSYKGKNGVFEYIIEPNGTCNHRLFKPKKR